MHEKAPDGRTVWEGEVQVSTSLGIPRRSGVRGAMRQRAPSDASSRSWACPVVDAKTAVQASVVAEFTKTQS